MHKKLALFGLTMLLAGAATAQNMERYVKLNVKAGENIHIEMKGPTDSNVLARIVSGSTDVTVEVNGDWPYPGGQNDYLAGADTLLVYGDITGLDCEANGEKITAVDASHNTMIDYLDFCSCDVETLNIQGCTDLWSLYCWETKLTELDLTDAPKLSELFCPDNEISVLDLSNCSNLHEVDCSDNNISDLDVSNCPTLFFLRCYGNNFTTGVIDQIYCDLCDRNEQSPYGLMIVLESAQDSDAEAVMATTKINATAKNWRVTYEGFEPIPETTGNFECHEGVGEETASEVVVRLAPNPANDRVTVSVEASLAGQALEVFDIFGRKVYSQEARASQEISVSDWANGLYLVKIGKTTTKLLKQ